MTRNVVRKLLGAIKDFSDPLVVLTIGAVTAVGTAHLLSQRPADANLIMAAAFIVHAAGSVAGLWLVNQITNRGGGHAG